ncbi:MAG: 50S ribosomal protein L18 [Armatimonadota bacterium]|nr:50S ribosomal protein L18 [Armatimonadota bacterium]MDR7518798.1 50S ribosomal protein L18 [Armatimonadota bacterium]MDR7549643.1 50S ribosomal protein L18 [Armatimonadota bacterium]
MYTRPDRNLLRQRRHLRARRRLVGRATRPRLSVYRSLKQLYAQLIDDETGRTLAATSTLDPEVRPLVAGKTKVEAARVVGQILAQRALARGITRVIFDRGGYRYHGRVQALAEAARAAGLQF